jgi:hypothetical protein
MSHPYRLPAVLGTAAVASLLAVAPALASEGTVTPPPSAGPPLPSSLVLVNFAPMPSGGGPKVRKRPVVRRARLSPRTIRRGQRARLRLSLSSPGRVRVTLQRRVRGRYVRAGSLTATARTPSVSVRLPRRASNGRLLPVGRYRVSVVAADSGGLHSPAVRRSLIVRRRAR